MHFIANKWWWFLLWPLSLLYRSIIFLRNYCYDHKIFHIYHLECRVISVGNIHVGGTGKTPTVIFLAQWLRNKGFKIAILSRGYKRKSCGTMIVADEKQILINARLAGDEPYLMAKRLAGVPVVVDGDRVRGAQTIVANFHPDIILLDDGMQHRRLYRDVDIVTFYQDNCFTHSSLLPAGPLREPLTQLRRAHLLWINGHLRDHHPLTKYWGTKPVIQAQYCITSIFNKAGEKSPSKFLSSSAVIVCGVAKPASFINTVHSLGVHIKRIFSYPDHYYYRDKDIRKIQSSYLDCNADFIFTTEKDWVKLNSDFDLDDRWHCIVISIVPHEVEKVNAILENLFKEF